MNEPFSILQPVTLSIQSEDGRRHEYPSQILDLAAARELTVGVPRSEGERIELRAGDEVTVLVSDPMGMSRHSCRVQPQEQGPPFTLRLTWPYAEQRIERRRSVRLRVLLPTRISWTDPKTREPRHVEGLVRNLSAGGAYIVALGLLPDVGPLRIRLPIQPRAIEAYAALVRGSRAVATPSGTVKQEAAFHFVDLSDEQCQVLSNYLLDLERRRRRRAR